MSGLQILGGIGLILFGVRFLRKGLDRLLGGKLVEWLARATTNPWKAFCSGICAGTIAPSSAGMALAASQMMATGRISSHGMLAVLLGANVGLTITVQLLAFHIEDYAGLMIITGIIGFQFLQRELFRGIGQSLLALGFVFLAIGMIGEGARGMAASPALRQALVLMEQAPMVLLVAAIFLSVILQSSTATIGLGLGLAASGLLTGGMLAPWVIGTNIGLGVTSLLAGWPRIENRRLGVSNFAVKLVIALPLIIWPALADSLFHSWPGSVMRQTAMFHTFFNLVVGLLALPLLRPIERVAAFLIPTPDNDKITGAESYLDSSVLDAPSLALARATRETFRMADHIRGMLESFWKAFQNGNVEMARRIQAEDDTIDRINLELTDYLNRIGEDKSPADTHWQMSLLSFSNELESIGDVIDKHLCDLLIKQRTEGTTFQPEEAKDLDEAYRRLLSRFEHFTVLLTTRDKEAAKEFLIGKETLNDWFREVHRTHYGRLRGYARPDLASSVIFLDYINAFRRINSHLSSIGYALQPSFRGRSAE